VFYVEPPYKTTRQQETIGNMKKYLLSDEALRVRAEQQKEEFLAGSGGPRESNRLLEIGGQLQQVQRRQIDDGEFFICGAYPIYVIKGRKPS
jgi:hypothetical protein